MSEELLTLDEVVRRAGTEASIVERLRAGGVIGAAGSTDRPYTLGDLRRVQLIEACVAADIELDDIVEAHRVGALTLSPLDLP